MKDSQKCIITTLLFVWILILISCGTLTGQAHLIVINEIMYAPASGEPEWIELFNRGDCAVDLAAWTIEDADSTRPRCITSASMLFEPSNYICVVKERSTFMTVFPSSSCTVLEPVDGWPRLNNSGDALILRDSIGLVVDALMYDEKWGGGNGTSLERIHPDWPTNDPNTWSSCVAPSLATPCQQNSLFTSHKPSRVSLSSDPNPFHSQTIISYRLTVPTAIIKLEIYDIRGRLVKILIDQEESSSTGSVRWMGKDDQGKDLRMGMYVLYLEAINAEMGVLDRAKTTVVLAKGLD